MRQQAPSLLLGADMLRLAVPARRNLQQGLARARAIAPQALTVANDLYRRVAAQAFRAAGRPCGDQCPPLKLTSWAPVSEQCAAGISIGVVDTAVDRSHPSLKDARITARTVRGDERPASDANHGTGVVSLLAGASESGIVGLLQGARIFAADAFHGQGDASAADVFDLVRSLDWLAEEQVRIVNLSLTGPDNEAVERAIAQVVARGTIIVAAAGRPDPADRLGYPARYDGVVGVAAVDARLRPSRLSSRGPHVDFVAPGVGLVVAAGQGATRRVDGTSFAAPFVTAALARGLAGGLDPQILERRLADGAEDLGAPGRDPVFGWGLVRFSAVPVCR